MSREIRLTGVRLQPLLHDGTTYLTAVIPELVTLPPGVVTIVLPESEAQHGPVGPAG